MTGLRRALWTIAAIGALTLATETALMAEADFVDDEAVWIALNWIIGGGFLAVGLYAWWRRPENRVGTLMVGTAFAWFVGILTNVEPAALFSIGLLVSNLFLAPAIHLLLAFPSGQLGRREDRIGVVFTYLVLTVGFVPMILTMSPKSEHCTACPDNIFAVDANPGFADAYGSGLNIVGVAVLAWVAYRLIARWREASPPMRRVITPVFISGALLMAALSALLLADLFNLTYSPSLWYVALVPFGLVPYLFLGSLVRAQMLRGGAVGELVATIGGTTPPDCLRDALARALNDPSLELAYWIPETATYVDESGRQVDLPRPAGNRAVSEVRHEGRLVAALIHDPMLLDEPELVDAVGAAAALTLEKERLDAELRAKIAQLRESRARMLAFGLNERRRLERDLHDGAQQRLVSLALDLRLAQAAVRSDPDRAEELLAGAGGELAAALEELRELARGIHPAVLSDRGLDPAVEALASRAPLPVEVKARLGERVAEPVELAAYFVVAEALTNVVKYSRANGATVAVDRENGSVIVEVADDGVGGADPDRGTGLRGLADRISALGGRLQVDSPDGRGTTVTARIPCE
ncbi:MAG TPA: histidine kinase [Solirubrobacterales bacterium]|nr:histidine kinase [Solirubrobacterales bacterium]